MTFKIVFTETRENTDHPFFIESTDQQVISALEVSHNLAAQNGYPAPVKDVSLDGKSCSSTWEFPSGQAWENFSPQVKNLNQVVFDLRAAHFAKTLHHLTRTAFDSAGNIVSKVTLF